MIFVTVGSSTIPFDRLLGAVETLREGERVVVQYGVSSVKPCNAECMDFVGSGVFIDLIREARVVVTHGGVGTMMTTLLEGKRPIVVPRRAAFGEAVDDHQVSFARRAAELGLVATVDDVRSLPAAVLRSASDGAVPIDVRSPIEAELRSYIEECVGPAYPTAATRGSRAGS